MQRLELKKRRRWNPQVKGIRNKNANNYICTKKQAKKSISLIDLRNVLGKRNIFNAELVIKKM
jgi:hypothetical protein